MNELTISIYSDLKAAVDRAMEQAVENFVLIGYLLKKAKDEPELLNGSGYSDYKKFAKSEYGLEESQVSRFVSINERYGDGPELLPQYKGFGQSKLAEMLTLPAAVAEELPTDITRQEIRDIKKEIAEENKISDLEIHVERAENPNIDIVKEFLKDWAHRNPEKFIKIDIDEEYQTLFENCVLTARVPGEGKLMMTESNEEITLTNMRTGEKKKLTVGEVKNTLDELNENNLFTVQAWEKLFGEPYPVADKENKPKEDKEEPKTEDKKPSEEKKELSDKENKPSEEVSHETITPQPEDILPPVSNAEILSAAEKPSEEPSEEPTEETSEAAVEEEEKDCFDYFSHVRTNVDHLEGCLNAGSNFEAKRIIGTIMEDLREIMNRL